MQELLVGLSIVAASAYLVRRFWPKDTGCSGGGCSKCSTLERAVQEKIDQDASSPDV